MKNLHPVICCCFALFSACTTPDELTQRCQAYADLGLYPRIIADIEAEKALLDQQTGADKDARLQQLADMLDTHLEKLLQQRRYCTVSLRWNGEGVYGFEQYRMADFPSELQVEPNRENQKLCLQWHEKMAAYRKLSPNAELLDAVVEHLLRGECPAARQKLLDLRKNYPTYCPERLQEAADRLATNPPPSQLECQLLAVQLPLGVIRETHVVE